MINTTLTRLIFMISTVTTTTVTTTEVMAYSIIAVIALIALLALKEILSSETENTTLKSFLKGFNIDYNSIVTCFCSYCRIKSDNSNLREYNNYD